eukprot:m.99687 g.99687  ORF g.99687 m.99687 type:complete len:66 (-) comp27179_c0_seq3:102-299(-)
MTFSSSAIQYTLGPLNLVGFPSHSSCEPSLVTKVMSLTGLNVNVEVATCVAMNMPMTAPQLNMSQ